MNRWRPLTTPFAALVVAAGCASAPTSSDVARSVEQTHPQCAVQRETKMVLGRTKLWAVRSLLNLTGEDAGGEARTILSHLRRIEISTYSLEPGCELRRGNMAAISRFESKGWRPMITDLADDDLTWILVREDNAGETAGMLVISVDSHELEVVRLDGHIDDVLMEAVSRDPSGASVLFSGAS